MDTDLCREPPGAGLAEGGPGWKQSTWTVAPGLGRRAPPAPRCALALSLFTLRSAQVPVEFFRLLEFPDGCSNTAKLTSPMVSSCKYVHYGLLRAPLEWKREYSWVGIALQEQNAICYTWQDY